MVDSDINVERFAHDVCVHVLEKFNIFKAPDDTRKHNKYTSNDFLPCVSRSVVFISICIRENFKNFLDDKYKTSDPSDKDKMCDFFDYMLQNPGLSILNCAAKMCESLALCTEYIQFVNTKDFTVSLNKLVIRWSEFFEKNLRINFESEGGFSNLHSNLEISRGNQMDSFYKLFISEYCVPYGARECTADLLRKCAELHGVKLVNIIDNIDDFFVGMSKERSEARRSEESPINLPGSEKPKPEEKKCDLEGSSSDTETSKNAESEVSLNMGSEASDSEMSQNDLLGIPPHEEMLRDIDPFFVDNIPSPPKRRSASKSPERQPGSNGGPWSSSKSREGESSSSADSCSSTDQVEFQEKVEQILSKLQRDMETLKSLLLEHGLLSMKSGRRGSRMRIKDAKDKIPPIGSEGLF